MVAIKPKAKTAAATKPTTAAATNDAPRDVTRWNHARDLALTKAARAGNSLNGLIETLSADPAFEGATLDRHRITRRLMYLRKKGVELPASKRVGYEIDVAALNSVE